METTNDILCEMRTLGQIYNKSTDKITRSVQSLGLRSYADRFEAARRRETVTICNHLNEILNEANGIAESVRSDYIEKKARRICDLCKQIDLQGNGAAMREREATCEKSSQVGNAAVAHSRGGFDYDFHDVLKRLASVCWHETMFADMQTYYAEEGVYVMRCKHGTPNAHYCIIRAKSFDEAISRAVFDLHKANESRELGVSKTDTATPTCKASLQVGNEHKPMTLDEAIAHAEEAVNDTPCGQEHKQLADWLKELREIKNSDGAKCCEALMQIRDSFYIDPDDNKCHSDIDASDLREICDAALAEPPEPIGNSAKLREALVRCVTMLDICLLYSREGYPAQNDDIRDVMAQAENALSAPVNTKPSGNVNNDSAIYNGAEMRQALVAIHAELETYLGHKITDTVMCLRVKNIINAALAAPARNCDVMPLETARKVWYVKEILPRLIGDLPLGKEVPFEEWFVSQQEQGGAK